MRLQTGLVAMLGFLMVEALVPAPWGGIRPVAAQRHGGFTYETPTEYYLKMRQTYPPRQGVTPDILSRNPHAYQDTVLELEGRLSGVVRAEDGSALLMLSTEKFGSLNLKSTLMPDWIQPGTRFRALVRAVTPKDGSVTFGMPDLLVVAMASASDIISVEQRWRQEAAQRAQVEKERQAALRQAEIRPVSYTSKTMTAWTPARGGSNTARSTYSSKTQPGVRGLSHRNINSANVVSQLSPEARAVLPYYQEFVGRWNPRLTEGQAQVIAAAILIFCEDYDVDPRLMVALIIAESDFRPQTTSNKGAMGLGQLMPDEVRELGITNPYDLVQNIYGAVYLMRGRLNKYSGGAPSNQIAMEHIVLALASYNAGMGAVKKYNGVPPYRETQNYVKKIERIYRELCGENPDS